MAKRITTGVKLYSKTEWDPGHRLHGGSQIRQAESAGAVQAGRGDLVMIKGGGFHYENRYCTLL